MSPSTVATGLDVAIPLDLALTTPLGLPDLEFLLGFLANPTNSLQRHHAFTAIIHLHLCNTQLQTNKQTNKYMRASNPTALFSRPLFIFFTFTDNSAQINKFQQVMKVVLSVFGSCHHWSWKDPFQISSQNTPSPSNSLKHNSSKILKT